MKNEKINRNLDNILIFFRFFLILFNNSLETRINPFQQIEHLFSIIQMQFLQYYDHMEIQIQHESPFQPSKPHNFIRSSNLSTRLKFCISSNF
jgi:hypothetical protein